MTDRSGCLLALTAASVRYECVEHAPAATVEVHTEEIRRIVKEMDDKGKLLPEVFRQAGQGGGGAAQVKNLVLRDKKRGGIYLVSCDKVRKETARE